MYNIIIPVIYRDYSFLKKTLKYLHKYLCPKKIYVITDIRFKRFLPNEILDNNSCVVIDENKLVDGMTINHIRQLFTELGRVKMGAGWYFQVF